VELDWTALGYAECQAIRAELASRYAPAMSALRGVRRECFRLGLISAEQLARSADLAGVRGERLPAGRHVSSLELLALFQSCAADPRAASGARDVALIAVLAGAALRRAEASALDLTEVDLGEGSLVVRGKGGRERRAFLAQGGEEALGAWIAVRGTEPGPLFVGVAKGGAIDPAMGGIGPDAILAILRRRARRAGVADFSAHDLRRTFIGEALEAGADLAAVQQLAGHRSVTTTARYDRRPEAARRQAARRARIPYVAPR
jgi:integrase